MRAQYLVDSGYELRVLQVEDVALSHRHDRFLILLAEALQLPLDVQGDAIQRVRPLDRCGLSVGVELLATLPPHIEAFQEWKPFHLVDELVGQSVELVVVSLDSHVYLEVILPDAAVDAALVSLLDVELGRLLLVGGSLELTHAHLRHHACLLRIARLMLYLRRWTRSVTFKGSLILVVWYQPLQPVVYIVLLLLQDAQVVVDGSVDAVEVGRAELRVSPPDQQLVLLVLKLGGPAHVETAEVLAHDRWIRAIADSLEAVQMHLVRHEVEWLGLG